MEEKIKTAEHDTAKQSSISEDNSITDYAESQSNKVPLNIDGIPKELKDLPNWLMWKAQPKDNGKIGKVPYYIENGKPKGGGQDNINACMNFKEALAQTKNFKFNGVGFVFDGKGIVGIDIDDCIINEQFTDEAAKLIEQFKNTYIERSQSGKGLHIFIFDNDIAKGYRLKVGQHRKGDYEIYEINRYFAITGNRVEGTGDSIKTYDGATRQFVTDYIDTPAKEKIKEPKSNYTPSVLSDSELLNVMKNDIIFQSLFYQGDITSYHSHSEADIALMLKLAWLTNGDTALMENLFSQSALANREKWQRQDYRQSTIDAAMKNWDGNHFEPQPKTKIYKISKPTNSKIELLRQELEEVKKNAPAKLTDEMIEDFLQSDFTDKETANMFVTIYGDIFKFNHDTDNWFTWQGNHWKEAPVKNNRLLYNKWFYITEWTRLQAKINLEIIKNNIKLQSAKYNDKEAKSIIKQANEIVGRANSLESYKKIESAFKIATGLPQVETYDKQYDADKYKFNLANKTMDLKSWKMSNNKPNDLITLIANVSYDENAKCAEWDEFIKSAIPNQDTRIYIQKFCGYCLLGVTEEDVFFFLLGQGGSGKTTFTEAITTPMGDYAKTFPIELLTASYRENTGEEPCSQLYNMRHCRLAFTNETKKNRKFDTMKLKDWTGGSILTARDLYKPPITFKPQFKILITGNFAPSIEDITDEGVRRRLRIIPFDTKPEKKNTKLKEIFATPTAKSVIFNWCLEGCKMYLADKANGINSFDIEHSPDEVRKALQQYYDANDNIAPFIVDQEDLIFDSDLTIQVKDVWRNYLEWCKLNNEKSLKRNEFVEMFLRRFKDNGVTFSNRSENKKHDIFKGIGIIKSAIKNQQSNTTYYPPPPPTDADYSDFQDDTPFDDEPKPTKKPSIFADD